MNKHRLGFVAIVATLLLTALPALANHSWGGYHWARTANPFALALGDNLTPNWDPFLVQTSVDWNISTVLDTVIVPGNTNKQSGFNTPKRCTPTTGRVEVCNSKYGNVGWLGVANIWISGTHITAGSVRLNDTYFNTPRYNTSAWKNLVTCQEVGHTFGLDHQDEGFNNANLNTCMDYTNFPESNQHPNAHDYEELDLIYGHLDTTTTIAKTSVSAPQAADDSTDPRKWGREVHRADDGRMSVFEQDLGDGNKVLRHVFWAESRRGELQRPER